MSLLSSFQSACENGQLEIAKQLLEKNPNINISANNDAAFRYACKNGHVKVVTWLWLLRCAREEQLSRELNSQ